MIPLVIKKCSETSGADFSSTCNSSKVLHHPQPPPFQIPSISSFHVATIVLFQEFHPTACSICGHILQKKKKKKKVVHGLVENYSPSDETPATSRTVYASPKVTLHQARERVERRVAWEVKKIEQARTVTSEEATIWEEGQKKKKRNKKKWKKGDGFIWLFIFTSSVVTSRTTISTMIIEVVQWV